MCNQNWFNCCPIDQPDSLHAIILKGSLELPLMVSTAYSTFTKHHRGTAVCCASHQPEGTFTSHKHWSWPVEEAYVSSLHIFRAYSFSSSGGQHSHSLCLLDQIGEDRRTPWLSPRFGGKERERSVLSASVIGRGADTQCMWQGQSGVEGPPAILTLIWSSCGWEHETLNKTAAMDPLPSCQLALSVSAERKHTRIHKQTQTHTHWTKFT